MPQKNIGQKGQVVIPKQLRDAIGLKPGVEVILELRGDEIVISKPKIEGSYTEYYITTQAPKLKKPVNIKELIDQEVTCGLQYVDSNVFLYSVLYSSDLTKSKEGKTEKVQRQLLKTCFRKVLLVNTMDILVNETKAIGSFASSLASPNSFDKLNSIS
jgi:AbrB family looped-hinge helix DNA binding protein